MNYSGIYRINFADSYLEQPSGVQYRMIMKNLPPGGSRDQRAAAATQVLPARGCMVSQPITVTADAVQVGELWELEVI